MASIIRIDKKGSKGGGNTHGWQVRVPSGEPRKYHSKLFSDGVYGSKGQSLVAAEAYLAQYLEDHPDKAAPKPYRSGKLMANNKSGITGVYRTYELESKLDADGNRRKRYYWAAFCPKGPTGKRFYKAFHIDKYGEEEARLKAVEFRTMWQKAADTGDDELQEFFQKYHYEPKLREREERKARRAAEKKALKEAEKAAKAAAKANAE